MATMAMTGMMGASMLMQASAEVRAGEEEEYALEQEGKQDEANVLRAEVLRKRDLAKTLVSQNAEAGVNGIVAFEGSPLAVMQEDIRLEKEDTETENYNAMMRDSVRRRRAKNAKDAGYIRAVSGLLMGGASLAESMGGEKKAGMGTSATAGGLKTTPQTTPQHKSNARFIA